MLTSCSFLEPSPNLSCLSWLRLLWTCVRKVCHWSELQPTQEGYRSNISDAAQDWCKSSLLRFSSHPFLLFLHPFLPSFLPSCLPSVSFRHRSQSWDYVFLSLDLILIPSFLQVLASVFVAPLELLANHLRYVYAHTGWKSSLPAWPHRPRQCSPRSLRNADRPLKLHAGLCWS